MKKLLLVLFLISISLFVSLLTYYFYSKTISENNIENIPNKSENVEFKLKSFYFNNPAEPTGHSVSFSLRSENNPELVQKTDNSAVLNYPNGLKLLLFYPTEGQPSEYTDTEYSDVNQNFTSSDVHKLKVDNRILSNWKDYFNTADYSNSYLYTDNVDLNCPLEGDFCSNNLIFLGGNAYIYLVCTSEDENLLSECDSEVVNLIVEEPVSFSECSLDSVSLDNYPNWGIKFDNCKWEDAFNRDNATLSISSVKNNSRIEIKFAEVQGLGFNGQCFSNPYEEISGEIVRVEKARNEYLYLNKSFDFAEKGSTTFKGIVVNLESLNLGEPIEEEDLTYCVNVFEGFITDSNSEYIDRFTREKSHFKALFSIKVSLGEQNSSLEEVDEIIKSIKY